LINLQNITNRVNNKVLKYCEQVFGTKLAKLLTCYLFSFSLTSNFARALRERKPP